MTNPKKRAEKQEAAKNREEALRKAKKDAEEDAKWSIGVKAPNAKKERDLQKKYEAAVKKAERDALEVKETENILSKSHRSGSQKKMNHNRVINNSCENETIKTYSASNIDDALELLSLQTKGNTKIMSEIDRHPERRYKSALLAYEEQRLRVLKEEHKGLRLQQYKDIIHKEFSKHPDNPMNQLTSKYNATKEELKEISEAERKRIEQRFEQK
ncbi:hypothetical protein T552_02886 [Pneumocystis carinii B80]|uniref:DUF1014-domain-containing protein n=1 Tax=Pneumocystis carinii (strain B80) TaxID=1408658 RepID=A0A0W4ZDK3_PNEC8|nr:hypothetical protein T552_02886 [Pneumocystis carinii B80]KTW26405.1 hypothetical protein T552_02886 [Pneumocystis carinii B80]